MFRLRRYRVYLAFALIALGLLYHFRTLGDIQNAGAAGVEGWKQLRQKAENSSGGAQKDSNPEATESIATPTSAPPRPSHAEALVAEDKESPLDLVKSQSSPAPQSTSAKEPVRESDAAPLPINGGSRAPSGATATSNVGTSAPSEHPYLNKPAAVNTTTSSPADPVLDATNSQGRLEVIGDDTIAKIHWSSLPEHFPVPTESLIQLPTGTSKAIPKIQHDFLAPQKGLVDQSKLDEIKDTFLFSWSGYRQKAWLQDELSPKSGKYRNPFCGWGATLVDTLDTLWMMDLKDEFEEAVDAVKDIDFTTSLRNDIPLFETVIRYLGGLVAAYDISGSKHRILLDKAVELADILMGSFDTPNRMPITFYLWKPTFASQPHRAKTRVVLAELGSLSVEFTRLAQITKEARYYDAIARITNEFEIWQAHTKLPGLWPMHVDASGCKKPDRSAFSSSEQTQAKSDVNKPLSIPEKAAANRIAAASSDLVGEETATKVNDETSIHSETRSQSETSLSKNATLADAGPTPDLREPKQRAKRDSATQSTSDVDVEDAPKRSPEKGAGIASNSGPSSVESDVKVKPDCEPQGLASPPFSSTEDFGLGGLADSTYEYLPKEYMLLGGLEPKYRSMYEMAADATKKHLIYRPMIPDEKRSILQAGLLKVHDKERNGEKQFFKAEGTHLICFVGGMFAVGAKLFDRKEDLDIAKKLTDGCVWAYESTGTGIMPESYLSIACSDKDVCPWNETAWQDVLDPYGAQREIRRLNQQSQQDLVSDDNAEAVPPENRGGTQQAAFEIDETRLGDSSRTKVDASPGPGPTKAAKDQLAGEGAAFVDVGTSKEKAMKADSETVADRAAMAQSGTARAQDAKDTKHTSSIAEDRSDPIPSNRSGKTEEDAEPADHPKVKPVGKDQESEPRNPRLGRRQLGQIDDSQTEKRPDKKESVISAKVGKITNEEEAPPRPSARDKARATESQVEMMDPETTVGGKIVAGASQAINGFPAPEDDLMDRVSKEKSQNSGFPSPTRTEGRPAPAAIPTREEVVAEKIRKERLPIGMAKIDSGRYLLRPEAIESVFILYRVTGDEYWREKGWQMFTAIEKHTRAKHGASAIKDVTNSDMPISSDEMESFWLAETLKYFYLLYSDPSHVSLDDYVL
ncbi:MAG: hypothetical protein OHK93_000215 [Ramalina farinacea]|uniref:alpha-1,2-Mannosidase n=1 Tax=Ramalina farinacea TaxID=258253 RepID=A0AA43QHR3_9LECA|nr:hypothetical protein [Ramalina farinacea]